MYRWIPQHLFTRQQEGITSPCIYSLLIGQHPHHMTLLFSSFYGKRWYGICLQPVDHIWGGILRLQGVQPHPGLPTEVCQVTCKTCFHWGIHNMCTLVHWISERNSHAIGLSNQYQEEVGMPSRITPYYTSCSMLHLFQTNLISTSGRRVLIVIIIHTTRGEV